MKKFLFFIFITLSAGLYAQTQSEMAKEIAKASDAVTRMECDFVQTRQMAMLSGNTVSKGKVTYTKPDKLRWEYTTPYVYVFAMNGKKVTITRNGKTEVVDANKNKGLREVSKMMTEGFFARSISDDKLFTTTIVAKQEKGAKLYIATLVPKRKELKHLWQKLVLHFDVNKKMVSHAELYGKNGDVTLLDFIKK